MPHKKDTVSELVEISYDEENERYILDIPTKISKGAGWNDGDLIRWELQENGDIKLSSSGKRIVEADNDTLCPECNRRIGEHTYDQWQQCSKNPICQTFRFDED